MSVNKIGTILVSEEHFALMDKIPDGKIQWAEKGCWVGCEHPNCKKPLVEKIKKKGRQWLCFKCYDKV